MTETHHAKLSAEQTLAAVPPLTRVRLESWVAAELVTPEPTPEGPAFAEVDVARLALACELCDEFELEDDALSLVLVLVDRLQSAEAELAALARVLAEEPAPVRKRIGEVLRRSA